MPYKDPQKKKEHNKLYQLKHKEELKEKRKTYRQGKEEYFRNAYVKHKYKIDLEEVERMKLEQNNSCAICNEQRTLVVDHDHKTGSVRGLLCYACNTALGKFRDNKDILLSAINYLGDN